MAHLDDPVAVDRHRARADAERVGYNGTRRSTSVAT